MRRVYDAGRPCGTQANMAMLLATEASWEAATACLQFHGGNGFACLTRYRPVLCEEIACPVSAPLHRRHGRVRLTRGWSDRNPNGRAPSWPDRRRRSVV